jgi:16S rRNA (uracil1498-N3)-methyltransferase
VGGEVAEQIRRVLRLRPGDPLTLLDGLGFEYHAILKSYGQGEAWAEVEGRTPVTTEPRVQVALYMSLLNKPDKFEWALQKCTELGAARFVPVIAERSVADRPSASRQERWERIIREASEQSGRGLIPRLEEAVTFRNVPSEASGKPIEGTEGNHIMLIPEVGQTRTITSVLASLSQPPQKVSILVGPEGGFTPSEVASALDAGALGVSLGRRILRSETAAVAALALVMGALGEMG